jgi:exopolyphosphatase/guanosine-5'-triphosphate,3'-diphosphate pyrophosphatase
MEINNSEITFKRFLEFSSKIKKKAPLELLSKFPFLGKRAESIVGGAYLGEFIGNQLQVETFEISTLGLRYGTIMSGGIDGRFRQSI